MSAFSNGAADAALQILFGVAAIFSVVVALFGLHYRDSLGFVLYRRFTNRSIEPYELEEGLQDSNSTASVQAFASTHIPTSTSPDLGPESSAATNSITNDSLRNTNTETSPV